MDKPKLREQRGNGVSKDQEGLATAPKVVLSYLAQRNQRATSQTRSPSHPSRGSEDQQPVDLQATWRTAGVVSARAPGTQRAEESEYIKFVEELLDRALKKDSENRGLSKKIREMEIKIEEMSSKMADLSKEVVKARPETSHRDLHPIERQSRSPQPSLPEELRATPICYPRASSEQRGTLSAAGQYKDERLKKVELRVAKMEKMIQEQAQSIKDGCMQELMVYTNNYLSAKSAAGTVKGWKKEEIGLERLSDGFPDLNVCLAALREEFNMKLQLLMEELQGTVTLRDLDQKVSEVGRALSKSSQEHLSNLEKRVAPLEAGFSYLKSSVERIIRLFESRITENEPQLQQSPFANSTGLGVNLAPHPLLGSEYGNFDENQRQSADELCHPSLMSTADQKTRQHPVQTGKSLHRKLDDRASNHAKHPSFAATPETKDQQTLAAPFFDPRRYPPQIAQPSAHPRGEQVQSAAQTGVDRNDHRDRVYFPDFGRDGPPYVLVDSSECLPGQPIRMLLPTALVTDRARVLTISDKAADTIEERFSLNKTNTTSLQQAKPPKSRQISVSPQPSSSERLGHPFAKLAEADTEASWNRVNRSQSAGHHSKPKPEQQQPLGITRRAGHSIVDSSTSGLLASAGQQSDTQQQDDRANTNTKQNRRSSSKSAKKQRKKDKVRALLGPKGLGGKTAA